MTNRPGPSARRRQLGAMLRQLRMSADKTHRDAAAWLEVHPQTLSKIELGRQAIKGPHVRLLCQLYGTDAGTMDNMLRLAKESSQRGWWTSYRDTVPEWFRQFVGFESDASELWEYQSEFVPGLLQTTGYMRAITQAAQPGITDAELTRLIELRQERQAQFQGTQPAHTVYLNEAIVHRVIGDPTTMRDQLDYLVTASERERTCVRVVPFSVGGHAAMASSFVLIQFPEEDTPAFAYLENDRGSVYQEDPGDIERYKFMVDQLAEIATSAEDTRLMLDNAARSL